MRLQDPLSLGSAYTCSKDLNCKAVTLQILTQLLLNLLNVNGFFEISCKIRQVCIYGIKVYTTQWSRKEYADKVMQLDKLSLSNLVTKPLYLIFNSAEQRLCSYLVSATFWSVIGIIHTNKPHVQRDFYIFSEKKEIFLDQDVSCSRASQK